MSIECADCEDFLKRIDRLEAERNAAIERAEKAEAWAADREKETISARELCEVTEQSMIAGMQSLQGRLYAERARISLLEKQLDRKSVV